MQLFSVVVFAALASANALPAHYDGKFDPAGLTQCGQQCYSENVAAAVGCDPTNMMSLCVNEPFHQVMLPCLLATCDYKDLQQTIDWVHPRCEASAKIAQKKAKAEIKAALKQAKEAAQAKAKGGN